LSQLPRVSTQIVITVSGHSSKQGWAKRALERLEEELKLLGVAFNHDKTRIVDTLRGEAFGFFGFDIRRVPEKNGSGYFILMTPKKQARKAVKARIRDIIRNSGAMAAKAVMSKINEVLTGWVNYFRIGNSSRAFSEVRDYVEMKVRTLLTRRKRRQKRSIGWRRWSNEYLYDVLGLYWDWKLYPLKNAEAYK
jgi:RNA-directed DNA polymerase